MQDKIWEWPGDEARPVLLSVIPHVLHSDQVLHVRATVKRELMLFQQAICYISEFQVSEHITCMDRKFCEWIG